MKDVKEGRGKSRDINTDADQHRSAWINIDAAINATRSQFVCLYSTEAQQAGMTAPIQARSGRAALISVPPSGFVTYD